MLISFPSPPHAHSLIITKEIWLVKLKLRHTSCNFSVSKAEVRRKCSRAFCELNCAICCIVMKGNTWKLLYCKFPFQEKSQFKVLCGILLSYLVSWWKHEWELQRSQNKHRSLFYTLSVLGMSQILVLGLFIDVMNADLIFICSTPSLLLKIVLLKKPNSYTTVVPIMPLLFYSFF